MNLKSIMLNEESQSQKVTYYIIPFYNTLEMTKFWEMENRLVVAKGSSGKDCCLLGLTVWDPKDCSPPGYSVLGILQARILERVAISFSRGASWPQHQTQVSWIAGRFFTVTREALSGGGGGLKS